jgi:hypothetical protein
MTRAGYERLYQMLLQSYIDRPTDLDVLRHTRGLIKALDRWLLKPAHTQARTARPSATLDNTQGRLT